MYMLKVRVIFRKCSKVLISILFSIITCLAVNCHALDPPPITPVEEFFVENNHGIPAIPPDWHLTIEGEVETTLSLSLSDLMQYPATTQMATLECFALSPDLVGNANWTGVSLKTILEEAGLLSGAESIFFHAVDGYSIGGMNLNNIMQRNDIILAYSMNGETLPIEQGYPVRLVLPGSAGYMWMQWLERIVIASSPPTQGFVHFDLHSKIFEPRNEEIIALGSHIISGMAFVGNSREIVKVEVSTDGGTNWELAQLLTYFVPNVWKSWEFTWEIPQVGEYQILTRVEDHLGNIQEESGFLGWSLLGVTVNVDYDADNDGIPDSQDNCPDVSNPDQADSDGDGTGDICDLDIDGDGICNPGASDPSCEGMDNCPYVHNPDQEDTYPPNGNSIGDSCDCEADFNCDGNVDGSDTTAFLEDLGRSEYNNPCTNEEPCNGDFNCDENVDATDVTKLLEDFGRSDFFNPCPACDIGVWCGY